jgi:hypothetical protein
LTAPPAQRPHASGSRRRLGGRTRFIRSLGAWVGADRTRARRADGRAGGRGGGYLVATTRYFVIRRAEGPLRPIPWEPPEPTEAVGFDTAYWGRVLAAMENRLHQRDLTVYVTWTEAELPSYGPKVVAVLVGDDDARVPRWTGRVRATFKSFGTRPERMCVPQGAPPIPAAVALALQLRSWKRHLPGALARARRRGASGGLPPVVPVPAGYLNQLELPIKPIGERCIDVSFAGSVLHWRGWWGTFTGRLGTPKVRSRQALLAALRRLEASRPGLRTKLRLTEAFTNLSPVTGGYDPDEAYVYSQFLMDTRICLAPRGASPETFRHFEALRAGCVVVTDVHPERWYLRGAPFVTVRSWTELEDAVAPLLDDPALLERCHHQSLDWWRTHCSEEVVGRHLADVLNRL